MHTRQASQNFVSQFKFASAKDLKLLKDEREMAGQISQVGIVLIWILDTHAFVEIKLKAVAKENGLKVIKTASKYG